MPIVNGYATLAELKSWLNITNSTDDTLLENAITAASRQIDGHTHRRFYAATETRYFTPNNGASLLVDDLLTVTTLKQDDDGDGTFEITWATTDYVLWPRSAAYHNPPGPYWEIRTTPVGSYAFTRIQDNIQIAGSWGYSSSAPADVKQACLIQSGRLFRRKDSPYGVAGTTALGAAIMIKGELDPDAAALLAPFVSMVNA
jgi:hypothetical protein